MQAQTHRFLQGTLSRLHHWGKQMLIGGGNRRKMAVHARTVYLVNTFPVGFIYGRTHMLKPAGGVTA
jgi:hypothetical protein